MNLILNGFWYDSAEGKWAFNTHLTRCYSPAPA